MLSALLFHWLAGSARAAGFNVTPTLGSVVYSIPDDSVTATFGYVSAESSNVLIPVGANNYFSPVPLNRLQVTSFLPGTYTNVFAVTFASSTYAEWHLFTNSVRAAQADATQAVVTRNVTLTASDTYPNIYVQNGATLTLANGIVSSATGGIVLEGSTRLRTEGGEINTPSITASGALATFELAPSATSASPFYFTRNAAPSGDALALSGNLKLLQTSGYTVVGGTQAHTGGTELAGGTLALGSAGALGTTGTISFTGGTLAFAAANTTDYSARFSTAAGQAYAFDTNGQDVALASNLISAGGWLTKSGSGTLRLSGNNTYSGGTTLNAGTLALESNTAVGTGTITLNGGTLRASLAPRTVANAVVLGGDVALGRLTTLTGSITVAAESTLGAGNPDGVADEVTTLSGSVALDHALTVVDGTGWGTGGFVLSGTLSGAGTLTQSATGRLTLSGNNTYAGGTTLNGGVLVVGSDTALGTGRLTLAGGALQATGSRTLANAVTLSGDVSISGSQSLTFTGNWNLARTREITVANTATSTISGAISGAGRSLNKFGSGTLVLTGANTYTGGTFIGEGTVVINNSSGSAFGSGAVTIGEGATLTGAGSFTGALQNNGTFSPGNSPTLEVLSSFTQGPTGTTLVELGGLLRGTHYDAFNIAGAASLDGTLQIALIDSFSPVSGATFNLFDWGSVTGTFHTVLLPSLASGLTWDTSALYTSGDLSVSAVPEPSTYAALLGCACLGFAAWRRRARIGPVRFAATSR